MIKFTGDICFTDNHFDIGYGVGSKIAQGLVPFQYIQKESDDIWIGNLECVTSLISKHQDYRKTCFRIDPILLQQQRLIDYFAVANNHVMEHGAMAYENMCTNVSTFSKGCFGSLGNKSIVFTSKGRTIAISAFSLRKDQSNEDSLYWAFPELSAIEQEYASLEADVKVAYIHWGVEFINRPSVEQMRLAHWLIDLGYDLIVGMHPHILQGYEIYKGKYIFYSLGNFLFNMSYEPSLYSVVVLMDEISGEISYEYIKIDENCQPRVIENAEVPNKYRFEYLNAFVGEILNSEEYVALARRGLKAYRKSHHFAILKNIYKYDVKILSNIVLDFIKRRLGYVD